MTFPSSTEPTDDPSAPMTVGAGLDFTDPHARLAPYYLRAGHVVAVALLALVFVLLGYVPLWHTDIWAHLKFGQWIVEHGSLADVDPFCPFAAQTPGATIHGWLSQAILYLLFHGGELLAGGDRLQRLSCGVEFLRLGHALVVTLRCTVLLFAFRRVSGSFPLAVSALTIMLLLSVGNIAISRPQVLGELCFALVLLALSRPVLSTRALLCLPALFVVWANLHGSFATGLVLVSISLLGSALGVALAAPPGTRIAGVVNDRQSRRLLGALTTAVLAIAVLNPAGPAIFPEILQMAAHPNVRAMDEWQPLHFDLTGGGHWAYVFTLALLAATQFCCRRWFSPASILLLLFFGIQPLMHQRMMIWWLMLVPWIAVRYWPDCLPSQAVQSVPSFRKTLLAVSIILLAALWSIPGRWLLAGSPEKLDRIVSAGTPWRVSALLRDTNSPADGNLAALQAVLRKHYPNGQYTGCVFASETLGDFFLWDLPPEMPVFIYTHVHLFEPAHWKDCLTVRRAEPGWREILKRQRVNLIAVEPASNAHLCRQLRADKEWRIVVDETDLKTKGDPRNRLFIAVRVPPLAR